MTPLDDPRVLALTGTADFSWPVLGILLAGTAVLTLGFVLWTILQPDRPAGLDRRSRELVDRAVQREREQAAQIRGRLDVESGRSDTSDPRTR